MKKVNHVERLQYSGGLIGLLFGSSKGKLQGKVEEMNQRGWNLHFVHADQPNLLSLDFETTNFVSYCRPLDHWE